jgi:hypothetical protein
MSMQKRRGFHIAANAVEPEGEHGAKANARMRAPVFTAP